MTALCTWFVLTRKFYFCSASRFLIVTVKGPQFSLLRTRRVRRPHLQSAAPSQGDALRSQASAAARLSRFPPRFMLDERLTKAGAVMIWGTFALIFAAAFTGASFYVNWVEQPARLKLEDEALLSEWGRSDSRGIALLAAYALLAAIAGFSAYFESQDVRWAFGALVIILSWPYAFFLMTPLDNQIRGLRGAGARSPMGPRRIRPHRTRARGGRILRLGDLTGAAHVFRPLAA